MTRKEKVLKALRPRKWTPGPKLTTETVGGKEGLRRLRELRTEGYVINSRRIAGKRDFEYRLVRSP